MSGSLKGRRSEEITQSNTSSPRGSEVPLEFQRAIEVPQNEEISGEGRGRRYRMDRWGIRGLETRVGRECSISRGEARFYCGGVHVGGVRGGSHSVTAGGGSSESESCQEL